MDINEHFLVAVVCVFLLCLGACEMSAEYKAAPNYFEKCRVECREMGAATASYSTNSGYVGCVCTGPTKVTP